MKPIRTSALIFSTFVVLSLQGCSYFTPYTPPVTQGTIMPVSVLDELQPGLTHDQVKALLGPAKGKDPFNPSHVEYVFYTTDKTFQKPVVHHLILDFDDEGYLESWKEGEAVTIQPDPFRR
jgi:outer membrane protein assembly factor BamE